MDKNYCRVFVTNIISDEVIEVNEELLFHQVVCDCTIEGTTSSEKGACRIFSREEYESVLKYGFYYVENLADDKQ